jgi:hypothetical protein
MKLLPADSAARLVLVQEMTPLAMTLALVQQHTPATKFYQALEEEQQEKEQQVQPVRQAYCTR